MKKLYACLREDEGATAIEYGLIAGLIAVVIIVGLQLVGGQVLNAFNTIGGSI